MRIEIGGARLEADLGLPPPPRGLVVFARGSGSSRYSPRNRYVAQVLQEGGLATLLLDLLTPEEEVIDAHGGTLRFDIGRLARQLVAAAEWAGAHPQTERLPLGYFGASTGAAAARDRLPRGPPRSRRRVTSRVKAPTLLIVGGDDYQVIELNRNALALLNVEKSSKSSQGLLICSRSPAPLDAVARLARQNGSHTT